MARKFKFLSFKQNQFFWFFGAKKIKINDFSPINCAFLVWKSKYLSFNIMEFNDKNWVFAPLCVRSLFGALFKAVGQLLPGGSQFTTAASMHTHTVHGHCMTDQNLSNQVWRKNEKGKSWTNRILKFEFSRQKGFNIPNSQHPTSIF